MWTENKIFKEDLEYITSAGFIDWRKLDNKAVFVTGATGLIGYTFVSALLYRNLKYQSNIKIIALVRNITKAKEKFTEQLKQNLNLKFVVGDVKNLPPIDEKIDYIIHGANPTASSYFVENPVETIKTAVWGTNNILNLAKEKNISGLVYLSSMEVYGAPHTDELIDETHGTTVDTMSVRSCYPEAKRLCEALCASYADEYKVPAKVVRLAQTFGPGIEKNDNRVFAEFLRCAIKKQDIVLQTEGTSKRCYLYTADAVTAILKVLLSGKASEAYNAANKNTYCSIMEMAQLVAHELANDEIKVMIKENENSKRKFSPPHKLNLDVSKLENLGWCATKLLKEMYESISKD